MPSKRRIRWAAVPVIAAAAAALAGCTPTELHGYMPGFDESGTPATNHTEQIASLWTGSWVILLIVGVITWGLMLWAMVVYRRRKGQTGLPVQLRYNMPIEIFFTSVPMILVIGLFAFSSRVQNDIEKPWADDEVDVHVTAIAKQWAWDFQYNDATTDGETVYSMGVQAKAAADGTLDRDELPTLVLPVDQKVTIDLTSRDVIHSFWIVDFLYKKDMYIGHDNSWSFIPTREGHYEGKCAELCGEYHSMMLFNVEVVSQSEYDAYIAGLEADGNVGDVNEEYNRLQNLTGTDGVVKESETEEGN
ncbi:cytochrome c oxidase subunit II [Microbacterium sorbitolivorans]|uniref:cytochrome-c oxidase n=1 Tax=Microbacterium sorbitolivorans TaxID=1867410 RepID=A0A367Y6J1_9MICO|nr:cytochrome c oxidase subunit II [Microbacterium sorbitolivorans]RCK61259.1 cytochrome c oxidase subunit II [Microbacterium sorbitolivorans]GGF33678.1 cytochrome c oxidase subunit II [Microbacterium sorbitolivorans]